MTRQRKSILITTLVLAFLFGTAWLAINVSWWFLGIYLVPITYFGVMMLLVLRDMDDNPKTHNDR